MRRYDLVIPPLITMRLRLISEYFRGWPITNSSLFLELKRGDEFEVSDEEGMMILRDFVQWFEVVEGNIVNGKKRKSKIKN